MLTTERAKLIKANEELIKLRQALPKQTSPKPVSQIEVIPAKEPTEIERYIEAVKAGSDTGNQKVVISGNLNRWKTFDWSYHPDLMAAKRTIIDWSKVESDAGRGLILAGNCGCGKSHIAKAIAEARGPLARFVNELDLIKSIQASYGGGTGDTEEGILSRYKYTSLLVYDDLGAYETNNAAWLQGIYYTLFNGRLENGQDIIITTNLPLTDHAGQSPLEEWLGVRLFSRILGQVGELANYVDLFSVPDYRMRGFR